MPSFLAGEASTSESFENRATYRTEVRTGEASPPRVTEGTTVLTVLLLAGEEATQHQPEDSALGACTGCRRRPRDSEHVWDGPSKDPTRQSSSFKHLPGPEKCQTPSPTVRIKEDFSRALTLSLLSPLPAWGTGRGAETRLIRPEKEKTEAWSREKAEKLPRANGQHAARVNWGRTKIEHKGVSDDPTAPNV